MKLDESWPRNNGGLNPTRDQKEGTYWNGVGGIHIVPSLSSELEIDVQVVYYLEAGAKKATTRSSLHSQNVASYARKYEQL